MGQAKTCGNCKHRDGGIFDSPCLACMKDLRNTKYWEPETGEETGVVIIFGEEADHELLQ